jgi:hypothetical protein
MPLGGRQRDDSDTQRRCPVATRLVLVGSVPVRGFVSNAATRRFR